MDMYKDYYAILGVTPTAEDIVIRAAYKALAQRYHPDKIKGDPNIAHKRMAEISEAFRILSDPITRKQYDKYYQTKAKNKQRKGYQEQQRDHKQYGENKDGFDEVVFLKMVKLVGELKNEGIPREVVFMELTDRGIPPVSAWKIIDTVFGTASKTKWDQHKDDLKEKAENAKSSINRSAKSAKSTAGIYIQNTFAIFKLVAIYIIPVVVVILLFIINLESDEVNIVSKVANSFKYKGVGSKHNGPDSVPSDHPYCSRYMYLDKLCTFDEYKQSHPHLFFGLR